MEAVKNEDKVTYHIWVPIAFLIGDHPPYNVWIERDFVEQFANAIREVDKRANRPIFVSLCKVARFHDIGTGIHDVAVDSADILRSFGILVTTADGMWRLMYGHAGNHWRNNDDHPDKMGVFATIEKFLFRQRVLLMCSVNVDATKEMNDLVKDSSMKVVNMEQMEGVLKEPATVEIGFGGGIPNFTSVGATSSSSSTDTVGGSRRTFMEYEKAPWVEANVKSMVPEPAANMNDMWFYVNHTVDRSIPCNSHFNGDDDEAMPHDIMKANNGYGKTCVVCSANETASMYPLWHPEWQRQTITTMAARIRTFTVKLAAEEGNPITDPQGNFAQFLKDIT